MELGNMIFGNSRGEYPVDRAWQDDFCEFLYECGFSGYGFIEDEKLEEFEKFDASDDGMIESRYFENDVFIVRPYYWGEDEKIAELPNFVYKPTGFELQWYKYPLRDSYMNQNITFEKLQEIIEHCKESILGNKTP